MIAIYLNPSGNTDEELMANLFSQAAMVVANGLASGALVSGEVTTVDWRAVAIRAEQRLKDEQS